MSDDLKPEPVLRTVLDFTQGWYLLDVFKYLPEKDDGAKTEVIRQIFDHMTADAASFIAGVKERGINYDMIFNPRYTRDFYDHPQVRIDDELALVQIAAYIWGLLDYNSFFKDVSVSGSLCDDFPYALEYVDRRVLVLISSPVTSKMTKLAMNALSSRRV